MSEGGGRSWRALAIGLLVPLPVILGALAIAGGLAAGTAWALLAVSALAAIGVSWWFETGLQRRLRTISAVLEAYREGDFSIRPRTTGDPLVRDVLLELDQLGDVLRSHRLGEMEAWSLLRKVMAEVDVVVLAIDEAGRIRLANDAAERLLERPARDLVGAPAERFGLDQLLEGSVPRILTAMPAGTDGEGDAEVRSIVGPWELRRGTFRLSGEPQTLVVLSDVSRALRDNERDAWRRLIRVMGHEINNSLSPIKSISESLVALSDPARQSDPEWATDLKDGLGVIARRAEALNRFMASYAKLARLPPPVRTAVKVRSLVEKIAGLETRAKVEIVGGPEITIQADADQLEQALINLVKNAAEATLEAKREGGGGVRVRWTVEDRWVAVAVEDDGPGVAETTNLFVPFFTTKSGGSGIGLVLSRQIVEGHEGQLTLSSRPGGKGAVARLRLPRD